MYVHEFRSKYYHLTYSLVQRIHWLRARAQLHRWGEEKVLVQYEMQWTVRYFLNEAKNWNKISLNSNLSPGAIAYAARQTATWLSRAAEANNAFKLANPDHVILKS